MVIVFIFVAVLVVFLKDPIGTALFYDLFMRLLKKIGVAPNYESPTNNLFRAQNDQVVGQTAKVSKKFQIEPSGEFSGMVCSDGAKWKAVSNHVHIASLHIGDEVRVVRHEGLTLVVEPLQGGD